MDERKSKNRISSLTLPEMSFSNSVWAPVTLPGPPAVLPSPPWQSHCPLTTLLATARRQHVMLSSSLACLRYSLQEQQADCPLQPPPRRRLLLHLLCPPLTLQPPKLVIFFILKPQSHVWPLIREVPATSITDTVELPPEDKTTAATAHIRDLDT